MEQQHSGYAPQRRQQSQQSSMGTKGLILGAAALIAYGLTQRSKGGAAMAAAGSLLAWKAATTKSSSADQAHATFLVNASREQCYSMWRDFENLPRFMRHLKKVKVIDGRRSEWTALGPLDQPVYWSAEITEDLPNQRIGWRSLPGSDIDTSGFVDFRPDPLGRGTYVNAVMRYAAKGGQLAKFVASAFGKHPEFMVREDVRRFKALIEAGEVPTTLGQTHGPRGIHGKTEQVLFRETGNLPEPQAAATGYRRTA